MDLECFHQFLENIFNIRKQENSLLVPKKWNRVLTGNRALKQKLLQKEGKKIYSVKALHLVLQLPKSSIQTETQGEKKKGWAKSALSVINKYTSLRALCSSAL